MELLLQLFDFLLHVDKYLSDFIAQYGNWTLALLFIIVFLETGFVVTPFLPGDS
ncbi:MAG: cytochrome O ubiquinol oxidase, partial [Anaerolineales bacterium]|nr:cytochrome O ubiquinol oxidase [Anaerolineales bacterium]